MPTICPNCLRPVRAGANYCGFCGSSLNSGDNLNAITTPDLQEQAGTDITSETKKLPGPTYDQTGRTVSIVAIILLFLVIIAALTMRYWPDIIAWLGQYFPG